MLLAIDIGNTRIKAAVFEHNKMIGQVSFLKNELASNIDIILKKYPDCTDLTLASVGETPTELLQALQNRLQVSVISHESKFPFRNLYQTPKTLGIDRLVLASGAVLQFPAQDRLVVDAGTCVTYDFVNARDEYLGGAIAPGIRLRYEAMHQYTAKLPLLTAAYPAQAIGNTTAEAMHVGVIDGIVHEIDGFIAQYRAQYPNIIIILTGGDTDFLAKRLKNTIFANSNFLLESLEQTFQYTLNND